MTETGGLGTSGGKRRIYPAVKRAADLIFASVLSALLIPLLAVVCVAVTFSRPGGGPFYAHERVGRGGKAFRIFKFRTMDAEGIVTRTGAFLRRSGLDELPQLWNIIRGDMSFVGPRPLDVEETAMHSARSEAGVYSVRPGLTGLAQIKGRDALPDSEKLAYDIEYVEKTSPATDAGIILATVRVLLGPRANPGGKE